MKGWHRGLGASRKVVGELATHLGTDVWKIEQNGRRQDIGSVQARGGIWWLLTEGRSLRLFHANKTSVTLSSQEPCALLRGRCYPLLVPGRRCLGWHRPRPSKDGGEDEDPGPTVVSLNQPKRKLRTSSLFVLSSNARPD